MSEQEKALRADVAERDAATLEKLAFVFEHDHGAFHRWTVAMRAGAAAIRAQLPPEPPPDAPKG
jgi:hypothetical protein